MANNSSKKSDGAGTMPPLKPEVLGDALTPELAKDFFRLMATTRELDDRASRYIRRGMGWSYHARCGGQEGIQTALGMSFRANKDFLFPYYRDMGTALAAGISPLEIFLNGLSRDADVCAGGRHMSNHFGKPEIGVQNVSSCTGNHTLHAVGVARGIKHYKSGGIAYSSQGESSASEGYCFEAFSGAARDKLPAIFVIQNNGYGISVPTAQQSGNLVVADNFAGIKDLLVVHCDGTDVFDSWRGMREAIAYVESGAGPAIVHAQCVRMGAHSNSDAHGLYRTDDEIAAAQVFDPVARMRTWILESGTMTEADIDAMMAEINAELDVAAKTAEDAPVPPPESVHDFVLPPMCDEVKDGQLMPVPQGEAKEKLREAINRTLKEEFRKNDKAFLWGQDVASIDKGGVFNLTKGMLQEFGNDRVFNAPIAEDFIVGTANGLCRFDPDIRVVIEAAQFADYVWPAMEQIVEMSHDYWRSKGQFSPNVVLRLASGGYITGGLYHSQNVEALMSHLPGLRVVYPAFADDASGLLRTAIRSGGMCFFLEPKYMYNRPEAKGPATDEEYCIPFGKGRVRREGTDLSVITYGNTVQMSMAVADKLAAQGHSVEVFDLRSIKPYDKEGIAASVKKTGKALIIHEDHLFNGIGGEIGAYIADELFMHLDGPVRRLGAKDIPIGFAKSLEIATLPQPADIEKAMLDLLNF